MNVNYKMNKSFSSISDALAWCELEVKSSKHMSAHFYGFRFNISDDYQGFMSMKQTPPVFFAEIEWSSWVKD